MSTNGPGYWDVAGLIHGLVNGAAPAATVDAAKEIVQDVAQEVVEEIKEVVASPSSLGTTESAPTIVASIAPAASNMSTALVRYFPTLSNAVNNTAEMCGLEDAPSSSYLGYALGGFGILSGLAGLYGISRLRADAQKCVSADVYAIAKDSQPALDLIKANSRNATVLALINNEANMRKLLALEEANKGTLAGIAKMKEVTQLVTLQKAFEPKVEQQLEDLKEVSLPSSSNAVVGTQAASSVPAEVASSSTPTPAPTAMDLVVAKIRQNPKATAVFDQMNEKSLAALTNNAAKFATNPKFMDLNDINLTALLIGAAGKAGQVIEAEKKAALKM